MHIEKSAIPDWKVPQFLKTHDRYIFHIVAFDTPYISNTVTRETYTLFEVFGDIGGLVEFVKITVFPLVAVFSEMKMNSLVANRLYYWQKSSEFHKDELSQPKE